MSSFIGEPQHYPMPMEQFGKNPYGKNLYRVVFAPSVRKIVGGKWADGRVEYRSRPTYSMIGNEWVLERWISAQDFAGMTEVEYKVRFKDPNSNLIRTGPWPSEGLYFMVMDAALKIEAIPSVGTLIAAIEFGRNNKSHAREMANLEFLRSDVEQREKASDDLMLAKIQERRPAFGNRPTSFSGGVHSTKSKVNLTRPAPFKPGGMKIIKEKVNA